MLVSTSMRICVLLWMSMIASACTSVYKDVIITIEGPQTVSEGTTVALTIKGQNFGTNSITTSLPVSWTTQDRSTSGAFTGLPTAIPGSSTCTNFCNYESGSSTINIPIDNTPQILNINTFDNGVVQSAVAFGVTFSVDDVNCVRSIPSVEEVSITENDVLSINGPTALQINTCTDDSGLQCLGPNNKLAVQSAPHAKAVEGSTDFKFTFTLNKPTLEDVSITVTTKPCAAGFGCAEAGVDYESKLEVLNFPTDGTSTSVDFTVTVLDDDIQEGSETFEIEIVAVDGGVLPTFNSINTNGVTGQKFTGIFDEEDEGVQITVTPKASISAESSGKIEFEVSLSHQVTKAVDVNIETLPDWTSMNPLGRFPNQNEYAHNSQTVTIPANTQTKTHEYQWTPDSSSLNRWTKQTVDNSIFDPASLALDLTVGANFEPSASVWNIKTPTGLRTTTSGLLFDDSNSAQYGLDFQGASSAARGSKSVFKLEPNVPATVKSEGMVVGFPYYWNDLNKNEADRGLFDAAVSVVPNQNCANDISTSICWPLAQSSASAVSSTGAAFGGLTSSRPSQDASSPETEKVSVTFEVGAAFNDGGTFYGDETFEIALSSASATEFGYEMADLGLSFASASATKTGTITDASNAQVTYEVKCFNGNSAVASGVTCDTSIAGELGIFEGVSSQFGINFKLDKPTAKSIAVSYDYTYPGQASTKGTVTFPPSTSSSQEQMVYIDIINDDVQSVTKKFTFTATPKDFTTLASTFSQQLRIDDQEGLKVVSITPTKGDVSLEEGSPVEFTVTLSHEIEGTLSIPWTATIVGLGNTPLTGSDNTLMLPTSMSGSLDFSSNEKSKTFTTGTEKDDMQNTKVCSPQALVAGQNEDCFRTVTVTFDTTGVTDFRGQTAIKLDNIADPATSFPVSQRFSDDESFSLSVTTNTLTEGTASNMLELTLSGKTQYYLLVDLQFTAGTAIAADITVPSSCGIIDTKTAANTPIQACMLTAVADNLIEGDETFSLKVSTRISVQYTVDTSNNGNQLGASGFSTFDTLSVTITEPSQYAEIEEDASNPSSVAENVGSASWKFRVKSPNNFQATTQSALKFELAGTAVGATVCGDGVDYITPTALELPFASVLGSDELRLSVTFCDDTTVEDDRTLIIKYEVVSLDANVPSAIIASRFVANGIGEVKVTITSDDTATWTIQGTADSAVASTYDFTITFTEKICDPFEINWSSAGSTAISTANNPDFGMFTDRAQAIETVTPAPCTLTHVISLVRLDDGCAVDSAITYEVTADLSGGISTVGGLALPAGGVSTSESITVVRKNQITVSAAQPSIELSEDADTSFVLNFQGCVATDFPYTVNFNFATSPLPAGNTLEIVDPTTSSVSNSFTLSAHVKNALKTLTIKSTDNGLVCDDATLYPIEILASNQGFNANIPTGPSVKVVERQVATLSITPHTLYLGDTATSASYMVKTDVGFCVDLEFGWAVDKRAGKSDAFPGTLTPSSSTSIISVGTTEETIQIFISDIGPVPGPVFTVMVTGLEPSSATLSGKVDFTTADGAAVFTDDPQLLLSISSTIDCNEGASCVLTIEPTAFVPEDVTVTFTPSTSAVAIGDEDHLALPGVDYNTTILSVFIPKHTEPFEKFNAIFNIEEDNIAEQGETFTITVTATTQVITLDIDNPVVTVTIQDNDDLKVKVQSVPGSTIPEGGVVDYTVDWSHASSYDVSICFAPTTSNTATIGGQDTTWCRDQAAVIQSQDSSGSAPAPAPQSFTVPTQVDGVKRYLGLSELILEGTGVSLDGTVPVVTLSEVDVLSFQATTHTIVEGQDLTVPIIFTAVSDVQLEIDITLNYNPDFDAVNPSTQSFTVQPLDSFTFVQATSESQYVEDPIDVQVGGQVSVVGFADQFSITEATSTIDPVPITHTILGPDSLSVAETEGGGSVDITITVSQATRDPMSVSYETQSVTATAEDLGLASNRISDYRSTNGILQWSAVEVAQDPVPTKTVSVEILNDNVQEGDRSFKLVLAMTAPSGFISRYSVNEPLVTITDDEQVKIILADQSAVESVGTLNFPISVSHVIEAPLTTFTADFALTTATAATAAAKDADFTVTRNSVGVTGGRNIGQANPCPENNVDRLCSFAATIKNDNLVAPDKTFSVTVGTMTPVFTYDAAASKLSAIGTILNDDFTKITVSEPSAPESLEKLTFQVHLSQCLEQGYTIALSGETIAGTATFVKNDVTKANVDFKRTLVSIPIDDTLCSADQTFDVTVYDDDLQEFDESFTVTLELDFNADTPTTLLSAISFPTSTTGNIIDDRECPTFKVSDGVQNGLKMDFTVSLSKTFQRVISNRQEIVPPNVRVQTIPGTAKPGVDYHERNALTRFMYGNTAGEVSTVFSVDLFEPAALEDPETFTVELSEAGPIAQFCDGNFYEKQSGTGVIAGDDRQAFLRLLGGRAKEGDGTMSVVIEWFPPLEYDLDFQVQLVGCQTDLANCDGKATGRNPNRMEFDLINNVIDFGNAGTGGKVTLPTGQTSVTFTIDIIDDDVVEPLIENFEVIVSPINPPPSVPGHVIPSEAKLLATIEDNDFGVLSVASASVHEGAGALVYAVSLDKLVEAEVTLTTSIPALVPGFIPLQGDGVMTTTLPVYGCNALSEASTACQLSLPLIDDDIVNPGNARSFTNTIDSITIPAFGGSRSDWPPASRLDPAAVSPATAQFTGSYQPMGESGASVSIGDVVVGEADGEINFPVQLSHQTYIPTVVSLQLKGQFSSDTAGFFHGLDYTVDGGNNCKITDAQGTEAVCQVSFSPSCTDGVCQADKPSSVLKLFVIDDELVEAQFEVLDITITEVTLFKQYWSISADNHGTLTVIDNDASEIGFTEASVSGSEGQSLTINVVLTKAVDRVVTGNLQYTFCQPDQIVNDPTKSTCAYGIDQDQDPAEPVLFISPDFIKTPTYSVPAKTRESGFAVQLLVDRTLECTESFDLFLSSVLTVDGAAPDANYNIGINQVAPAATVSITEGSSGLNFVFDAVAEATEGDANLDYTGKPDFDFVSIPLTAVFLPDGRNPAAVDRYDPNPIEVSYEANTPIASKTVSVPLVASPGVSPEAAIDLVLNRAISDVCTQNIVESRGPGKITDKRLVSISWQPLDSTVLVTLGTPARAQISGFLDRDIYATTLTAEAEYFPLVSTETFSDAYGSEEFASFSWNSGKEAVQEIKIPLGFCSSVQDFDLEWKTIVADPPLASTPTFSAPVTTTITARTEVLASLSATSQFKPSQSNAGDFVLDIILEGCVDRDFALSVTLLDLNGDDLSLPDGVVAFPNGNTVVFEAEESSTTKGLVLLTGENAADVDFLVSWATSLPEGFPVGNLEGTFAAEFFAPDPVFLNLNEPLPAVEGLPVVFEVSWTGPEHYRATVEVNYQTSTCQTSLCAAEGEFLSTSGKLFWDKGDTSTKRIAVSTQVDDNIEAEEQFTFELFNIVTVGFNNINVFFGTCPLKDPITGTCAATGRIINANRAAVEFSSTTVTGGEGATLTFKVQLDRQVPAVVNVPVEYVSEESTFSVDFLSLPSSVTIPTGEVSADYRIVVGFDNVVTGDTQIKLRLGSGITSNPPTLANSVELGIRRTAVGTVKDADTSEVTLSGVQTSGAGGGNLKFKVDLSKPVRQGVTFSFSSIDQNAVAGLDYTLPSGLLTVGGGDVLTTLDVPVSLLATADVTPDLTFKAVITLAGAPTGVTLGRNEVVGTKLKSGVAKFRVTGDLSRVESETFELSIISDSTIRGLSSAAFFRVDTQQLSSCLDGCATPGLDYVEVTAGSVVFNPVDGVISTGSSSTSLAIDTFLNFDSTQDLQFGVVFVPTDGTATVFSSDSPAAQETLTILHSGNVPPPVVEAYDCGAPFVWIDSGAGLPQNQAEVTFHYNSFQLEQGGFTFRLEQNLWGCFNPNFGNPSGENSVQQYRITVVETGTSFTFDVVDDNHVLELDAQVMGWSLEQKLTQVNMKIIAVDRIGQESGELNVLAKVSIDIVVFKTLAQFEKTLDRQHAYYGFEMGEVPAEDVNPQLCKIYSSQFQQITGKQDCCSVESFVATSNQAMVIDYCVFDDLGYPFIFYTLGMSFYSTHQGTSKVCIGSEILSNDQCFYVRSSTAVSISPFPTQYVVRGQAQVVSLPVMTLGVGPNAQLQAHVAPNQQQYLDLTISEDKINISVHNDLPLEINVINVVVTVSSGEASLGSRITINIVG
jgi:hypothetical protein